MPRLEVITQDQMLKSGSLQNTSFLTNSQNNMDMQMVNQIRSLERFCNEIAANKLLWTPEVLIFFQVPVDMMDRFEAEREQHFKAKMVELNGRKR